MRQLQNDLEKIRSFYQNHRSNIPPDSAFTYGLINSALGRKNPYGVFPNGFWCDLCEGMGVVSVTGPRTCARARETFVSTWYYWDWPCPACLGYSG